MLRVRGGEVAKRRGADAIAAATTNDKEIARCWDRLSGRRVQLLMGGGMELFEAINNRKSVRAFEPAELEEGKLNKILQATNRAPSAGNLQAYEIYAIRETAGKREVARAALHQDFISSAPVILVFCSHAERSARKYRERGKTLYSVQDATIACSFAMLAATAEGLGTVWVGAFNEDSVSQLIGAPEGVRPVAILPIGYPAEVPKSTPRRRIEELVHEASKETER